MLQKLKQIYKELKVNFISGLTVGLVLLPLSIALATVSGSRPVNGVITAIWASFTFSILKGHPLVIIGVAGALTSILAESSLQYGAIYLPVLAILSGFLILLAKFIRIEKYLVYIPSSVIYGFSAGVALLIIQSQVNDIFKLQNILPKTIFFDKIQQTFLNFNTVNWPTFSIFALALFTLIFLSKINFKIPGSIIVTVIGILGGVIMKEVYHINSSILLLYDKYTDLTASLADFSYLVKTTKEFQLDFFLNLIISSSLIAFVSLLETSVLARITDNREKTKAKINYQFPALAGANLMVGLFGGFPVAGGFPATNLNIKSKAKSEYSGIVAAFSVAILAFLFLPFFKYLPIPIICAILVYAGSGLIDFHQFKRFYREDKRNLVVSLVVAVITVFVDAGTGILIGTAIALLMFIEKVSKGGFEAIFNHNGVVTDHIFGNKITKVNQNSELVVYSIEGIMAFVDNDFHSQNLQTISKMENLKTVILRLRDLFYLDLDGLDSLSVAIENFQKVGIIVYITSPQPEILKILLKKKIFQDLEKQGYIKAKTETALKASGLSEKNLKEANEKFLSFWTKYQN